MVERIRNVRNKKALIQLNLNLTLPKLSRSHFSFVQKHFGIIHQYAVAAGRRPAVAWVPIRDM